MFNLLRSTRHKKKSSKNTQSPANSASDQRQQQRTTTTAATAPTAPPAPTARSYRAARARATAAAEAASSNERYRRFNEHERERAAVAAPPAAASRATIDELDDDLREFDFVDVDDAAAGSFCDRRSACEQQKVNLASNTPQRAARSARSATETTNSAISAPAKEFAFSKDDADGINKIVAATALSAAGAGANSQYEPTEWQGHIIENDRNGTGDEHREHVPTTGKRWQISDTFRERSHVDNASDKSAIRSTAAPLSKSSIDAAQQSASCSQTVRGNAPISAKSQQQVAPPAEEAAAVKYRKHSVDTNGGKEAQNFERKRQSRLSLTLGLGGGKNKSAANDTTDNSNKELKRSHVGQSLRRSFFRHKTKSIERDSEPDRSHDQAQTRGQEAKEEEEQLKRPNSALFFKAAETATGDKSTTRSGATTTFRDRGPLQRSKEFLSDIFMARGRNNNRNKSQGNLQQQSQHSQSKQQQAQSASFHDRQTAGNPPPNPNTIPTTRTTATPMLGANINHCANNNGKNNEQHVTAWTQHSAHLETSCDPAASMSTNTPIATTTTTPATANTYQMTMSNNSPKNFSRSNREREERAQQRRSNSAEHVRDAFGARVRARSEDPRAGEQAGASTWRTPSDVQDCQRLNGAVGVEQRFNRASNSERNGTCNTADTPDRPSDNVVDVVAGAAHDRAQDQQRQNSIKNERRNARESRSPTPLLNVDGTATSHAEDGGQLNELTECDRDNLLQQHNERDASEHAAMGQANAKADTPRSSRASTPRDFRESIIPVENMANAVLLPTITVMDYGDVKSDSDALGTKGAANGSDPVEQEVFYDFESESGAKPKSVDSSVNITAVDEDGEEIEDEVFQEQAAGATYRNKWSPSAVIAVTKAGTPSTMLEDVPEQEEEEDDEEDANEYDEDEDDEEEDDDDEAAELEKKQHKRQRYDDMANSAGAVAGNSDARNLDNELYRQHFDDSPERSPLKSTNTSDSNLSTSFPDSGLGDSISSSPSGKHLHGTAATAAAATGDNEMATSAITTNGASRQQQQQQKQHSPFVRDGNSTDCDDTLLQYDDLDYAEAASDLNERLVCIESISLPDVVVESTTGSSGSSSTTSLTASSTGDAIVNINGATGNSMGNVHFIPIHIESGSANQSHGNGNGNQKRRSVDDSAIGCNGKKSFAHMNGLQSKPIIEIVEEDASETDFGSKLNGMRTDNTAEKLKRELIEQKSRLNVQLEDAQKNVHNLQSEVGEMQTKIRKLEEELSSKTWNVERLQNELIAAQKDDDCVRKRLKVLEAEKLNLRHQYDEYEDEFKRKYEELEVQYQKLEEKYERTQNLARSLQTQLAAAQTEAEEWRKQVEKIRGELEEQLQLLKNALDNSEAERKINEDKWQKEFEMLRTQNMDREESLMTDCEWQLRQMQKQFKDKHEKSETERHATREKVDMLETALLQRQQEVDHLKVFQAEVSSLRGVVTDQEVSIQSLMQQIETLKVDLETANRNLEQQIQAVKQIKHKCDNAISDKERQTIYRIDEVRNEAAAFWENKLYTEMTRLKNELESVYVDERREALNKLQTEHIEELRALTTRYTANEEELRVELAELQEKFERRNEEFLELRERTDNSLLQTRMHLDRADREYQNAMCREEDRREALEESLRKEFETERTLMEERFRERLGQVKDEFAKELQNSTQEHAEEHQKEIAKQKAKLQAQKDDAIQELTERYKKKLAAAEDQMKDIELRHQHDLKDLKAAYLTEKTSLDKRDISNANEIEQLHRKCRCLTNLFEEMRMRYERRDPRPEDLREIAELRSRCESQERDLYLLTDRLRELQNQMSEEQQNSDQLKNNAKQVKKPPPKTIPTNCDVIYEENEERESPPPQPLAAKTDDEDEEEEEEEEEDEDEDEDENEDDEDDIPPAQPNDSERKSPALKQIILNGKELNKNRDLINEDDSQMITAV